MAIRGKEQTRTKSFLAALCGAAMQWAKVKLLSPKYLGNGGSVGYGRLNPKSLPQPPQDLFVIVKPGEEGATNGMIWATRSITTGAVTVRGEGWI